MMARAPPGAANRETSPIFVASFATAMPPRSAALLLHLGKLETET
jgi:hypothetical protein